MKKRIAFIFGGRSGEHEISMISCKYILRELSESFEAFPIYLTKAGEFLKVPVEEIKAISDRPKEIVPLNGEPLLFRPYVFEGRAASFIGPKGDEFAIDAVFSVIHGTGGEDGQIQGFFETAGVPVVGSSLKASALGMDKTLTKRMAKESGVPVVPFQEIRSPIRADQRIFPLPVFVKPVSEGSSLGIYRAETEEEFLTAMQEARRISSHLMIEPAIEKPRELEVAVFDDGKRVVSPVGEIRCVKCDFYSYEAKYEIEDAVELVAPAEISPEVQQKIQDYANKTFDALQLRGLARIDFFLDSEGRLLLNEVNTMPGFTPISMYPRLMKLAGIEYPELLERLIRQALGS